MAAGSLIVSFILTLTAVFPSLTPLFAPFYSGIDTETYLTEEFRGGAPTESVGRMTGLRSFGSEVPNVLFALLRPLRLLNPINLLPFLLFVASIAAIFLSGFRGVLIGVASAFVIASYFWGGMQEAIRALFLAFAAVVVLVAMQAAGLHLPLQAQRALSFLPGEWDQMAVADAEGSTGWRVDMWKTVLENPDKFLRNPAFGTGFGFSQEDLNIQLEAAFGGQGYIGGSQFESQLITGGFHSGPLSTVRFVGIVGLLLFYPLMITMAVFAFRLVNQTRGTPFFYLAVYLAVPAVYAPFSFTFIYGAFDSTLQYTLFSCAMLRCASESVEHWLGDRAHAKSQAEGSALAVPLAS
jgi:hypothetical protein